MRWAALIKKVYEADPLLCPRCGGGKAMQSIESVAQSFKLKKVADAVLIKGKPEGQTIADFRMDGVFRGDRRETIVSG